MGRDLFTLRGGLLLLLSVSLAAFGCESDDDEAGSGSGDGTGAGGSAAGGGGVSGGSDCENDVCVVSGTITDDLTMTADKQWLLRGGVFIGDDVNPTTLTIEAGTTIFGETSTQGMLVIRRNSKVMAEGTADAPIVFTSSKEEGQRARGDWGGVIINGNATINACAEDTGNDDLCEAFGEGGTGFYGGTDDSDNSGVLKYVRIEFAGRLISPDNELNGLALQGVGSGTVLDTIQIHMNKDDGIEFYGGTVNFKRILTTGIGDDNLDWTDGWRGMGQFFIAQQYDDAGDNGIEADNNGEDNTASPKSSPTISNMTLIGSPMSEKSDLGILLREGTEANLFNIVITGWNDACFDVDHEETLANYEAGNLNIRSSIANCDTAIKGDYDAEEMDGEEAEVIQPIWDAAGNNTNADPMLGDPYSVEAPDYTPAEGSPALTTTPTIPADDFFEEVDFIGGVGTDDWTAGWTIHRLN